MQYSRDISNTFEVFKARYGKKRYPIYWLLLFFVIGAMVSLPFIPVEISSQARGMVRPRLDNAAIVPVVGGKIERTIIGNNRKVKQGDTLLVVEHDALQAEIDALETNLIEFGDRCHDALVLSEGTEMLDSLYTEQYQRSCMQYIKQKNTLQVKHEQARREYNRNQIAYKQGAISEVEFLRYKDALESASADLSVLESQQRATWRSESAEWSDQIVSVHSGIEKLVSELRRYVITAPYDGTLMCSYDYREGGFVYAGQSLADLSSDTNLIVECYVSPSDIGYIFEGQNVSLQFDAFDYNQWGLGKALVSEIDPNLRLSDQGTWFVAKCKLLTDTLTLKNGYIVSIKKGMTLTGRFRLTERTLWQLLYDTIDDWMNPKIQNTL